MKRTTTLFLICLSLLTSGCEDVDVVLSTKAQIDTIKAVTLSDEAVRNRTVQDVQFFDSQNKIATSKNNYRQRLKKLTDRHVEQEDYVFKFKVYLAPEINAYGMAAGTIRISSGLMDMMDDQELLFVIGHEVGHAVKDHVRKRKKLSRAAEAVRKGTVSINNEAGNITSSQIDSFIEKLLKAQFSQQEEREADDYGLLFLKNTGYEPMAAISALKKLAALGNNHTFLSSHPSPEERADRLEVQLKREERGTQRVVNSYMEIAEYALKLKQNNNLQ